VQGARDEEDVRPAVGAEDLGRLDCVLVGVVAGAVRDDAVRGDAPVDELPGEERGFVRVATGLPDEGRCALRCAPEDAGRVSNGDLDVRLAVNPAAEKDLSSLDERAPNRVEGDAVPCERLEVALTRIARIRSTASLNSGASGVEPAPIIPPSTTTTS
jgi:hypothetical protein